MAQDGIEQDLSPDIAEESFGKITMIPDSPSFASEVEETWHEISSNMPILRQQIARIAMHYGGQDAEKRGEISAGLVSLYIILRDSAIVSKFVENLEDFDRLSKPTDFFDQDAA